MPALLGPIVREAGKTLGNAIGEVREAVDFLRYYASDVAGQPADAGVLWSSTGDGEFTLSPLEKTTRGTEVTLHLKDDAKEFLDDYRLKSIIRKYSDHIQMPIVMKKTEWDQEKQAQVEKDED